MYFYLLLAIVVGTISYVVYRKVVRVQENKTLAPSSSSSSSSSSCSSSPTSGSSSSLSLSSSPPSRNWEHHVFVSFRGEDVRTSFLSHILKEFQRKGINPFIDNEMEKGASISPKIKQAIKGSRIAIVLISKKYASSSWCLNELVKIIKCRKKIGQKVITIFYQVEPTDVKKQAGDFGKVFEETCKGKTFEVIQKWREALAEVATIVGYDSTKWVNEASAIEEVAGDISKMLIHLAPSHYLDRLIGMDVHMKKMQSLLCLDLEDEVRMIGIWGPLGIGKSTISRYLFNQLSNNFQLTAIMVNIKQSYPKPCLDEGSAQLQLQNDMLSKMINHKDIIITHLGAAQDRLKDKKVLLVLDDVDEPAQLVALAEDISWFGPGSRIIIATEDLRILLAHGIGMDRIYKVKFPSSDEAFQMFCMYAFRQKFPYDGFIEITREITYLAGNLPLGLQVMGSYFLRRPHHEWIEALPKLRSHLDGKIESILKFSYDALCDEYKDLFLHIACYFNDYIVEKVEAYLAESFTDVRQGIQVLAEKSLIYFYFGRIRMHDLLIQLGREIVRKQSGKCQFLVGKFYCEVLVDITTITTSVVGIDYKRNDGKDLTIRERTFERMSNLQFLRFGSHNLSPCILSLSRCLTNIPSKLRLLDWDYSPLTCWPTTVKLEFLVELNMCNSKLEKLWKGTKQLQRLKWMDLSFSENLRELPDLSTATSLKKLNLRNCSSLVELPSSIGNTTNLQKLNLSHCTNLVELPCSIGNATNLQKLNLNHCSNLLELPCSIGNTTKLQILDLSHCSSLVELPCSIGNLHKLEQLKLKGCSKLEFLPTNINMKKLDILQLTNCLLLKSFPKISTNIRYLYLTGTPVEEVPSSIMSWSRLEEFHMSYNDIFMEMPYALDTITELNLTELEERQELGTWIKRFTRLRRLVLNGMKKLISLPQLPDSLLFLHAEYCTSLQRLDCSFRNPDMNLNFINCYRLNQGARDLIIQTSTLGNVILHGGEVPIYFNYRASGNIVTVKFNEKEPLGTSTKYRACLLLVNSGGWRRVDISYRVASKYKSTTFNRTYNYYNEGTLFDSFEIFTLRSSSENLFIFNVEINEVTTTEFVFEFEAIPYGFTERWRIKECGVVKC